jgi:peptidoglycan/LPS O-acetylase OafA/YrhL
VDSDTAGRIRSLDGLRAVSVCAVLLGHLRGTEGFPLFAQHEAVGNTLAHLGVTVFFVISGFLITGLLMREKANSGRVSLRDFYVRRMLRIFPAFTVFVFVMFLAWRFGLVTLTARDIATALTWTVNFNPKRSWTIGHLWSLSVEEQFYLIWPITVAALGFTRGRNAALAAFFAAPVVRAAMHVAMPHSPLRDLEIFPAVADAIAIGCFVAIERHRLLASRTWQCLTRPVTAVALVGLIGVISAGGGYTAVDLVGGPITLIAIAAIVEGSTRWDGPAGWFLNAAPIAWIGALSYSLYLWQQPFLNRSGHGVLTSFPVNLFAALICATASYYFVEAPFRKLRKQFSPRRLATRAQCNP